MNIQLDDAFQFGLGAFETICLRNGKAEFLDWHLERLNHSLEFLDIRQSVQKEEAENYIQQLDSSALGALKIMVSGQNKLFMERNNPYTEERCKKGFRLDFSPILRNETSPLVRHKTMNYGDNIMEKRRIHDSSVDELIFINTKGEICEGCTTNIFLVRDGQIFTPPVQAGLLPGVMRRFIIESMGAAETAIRPEELSQMEECFVTNSLMGIMPVTAIGNIHYEIGPVTKSCRERYTSTSNIN